MAFSKNEYQRRLEKCQKEMKDACIDVLLLTSEKNIYYLSGYRTSLLRNSNFRLFSLMIFQTGEPVLIVPNLEIGAARIMSWFKDVRFWGPGGFASESTEAVKKMLEEKNLLKATVGAELAPGLRFYMTQKEFQTIGQILPGCRFVDCNGIMWKLRMIKSQAELEYMREASRITCASYEYLLDNVRTGMTEKEIHKIVQIGMIREGCEVDNFVVVTAGDMRYSSMNPWPTDYVTKKGDLVLLDWGASFNGYWSDLTRIFALGSVTDHQKQLYQAANRMREVAIDAARPGVPVGEIDKAATKFARESGLIDYMLHRSGHAIGLQVHELPSISATDETIMNPGMCLTIEPALYDFSRTGPSRGAFRIEDLVAITPEGCEVYSQCTTELEIVA